MSRFMSEPGRFRTGVNYWSSRSATRMWRNWDPAEVEADFALFEEAGMEVVRVFPIWSEFQPIMAVRAAGSVGSAFCREYRFPGEEPIPDTPAGAAGRHAPAGRRPGRIPPGRPIRTPGRTGAATVRPQPSPAPDAAPTQPPAAGPAGSRTALRRP